MVNFKLEERLLGKKDSPWFYLYSIIYDATCGELLIIIGPNTDLKIKNKWIFKRVSNFTFDSDSEENSNSEFPKMILGIDFNKDNVVVLACTDTEYIFETENMPTFIGSVSN